MPVAERGPGASYRPDDAVPSVDAFHQPGVTTPVLDHLAFAALDLATDRRDALRVLMRELTASARRVMDDHSGERGRSDDHAGERARRAGASLTVTLGLGPGAFDARLGLPVRRPIGLAPLPAFAGDDLDPAASGGDLCLQVCATDPAAAERALGDLLRRAEPAARMRWSQRGTMHRRSGDPPDARPRNLLGFKDATANPRRGNDLDRYVWVSGRERSFMLGGTFLVARRVRIDLGAWKALTPTEQERVIGRHRDTGAPLGRRREFDPMPGDGSVPADAHALVASPAANRGIRLLRRGYSFDDGVDTRGAPDAGLFLLLYQRDPRRQFVPLQRRLSEEDALRRFTTCVGSAVFAIPPGARGGESLAAAVFDA